MTSTNKIDCQSPLTADQVLAKLGEGHCLPHVQLNWNESLPAAAGHAPDFLKPAALPTLMDWAGLDRTLEPTLSRVAARVSADPALRRLAAHAAWSVFDSPQGAPLDKWPSLEDALGGDNDLFYLLIALEAIPRIRAFHASLGIPESVTRDTCRQVADFQQNFFRGRRSRLGIYRNQLAWLRHYPREPYFRIGRFEFWLKPAAQKFRVFRHRTTGAVATLAGDGWTFRPDGYRDKPDDLAAAPDTWTARLTEDETGATGCLVSPDGRGRPGAVRLPAAEWECALREGDMILDMHIPAGGQMTPAVCADSMRRALPFFERHYPGSNAAAIVSVSWIFSPLLEDFMPADSNLVQYLQELHLFPVPSAPTDGLWFIFFQDTFDPAAAPRDSRLQRAMLDFITAGNRWRIGGMFMLAADVSRFGSRHYRSHD